MRMSAILAVAALIAIHPAVTAARAGDEATVPEVRADASQVYLGKGSGAKAPGVVDADRVYRAVPEYQRILAENLTEKDVRYSFLMVRATKKFKQALSEAAREEGRDLVGNVGSVRWGDRKVPDITDTVMAHLKAIDAAAALQPGRVPLGKGGALGFAPEEAPKEIDLSGTKLADAGLDGVKGLDALLSLDLAATAVGDEGIAKLKGLATLERLVLAGTNVTDKGLAALEGLAALRVLDLSGTRVTDGGMASVARIQWLLEIRLAGTEVGDAGLEAIGKGVPSLQRIDLTKTKVTDGGAAAFAKARPGVDVVRPVEPVRPTEPARPKEPAR